MKKQLLFLFVIVLNLNGHSQVSFEKGYYIDNTNQKVDCLIKNSDWVNNPSEFDYKLTENSEPKTTSIKLVKEFGIDNISKYIKAIVNIDRSSDYSNNLSNNKNPKFKEEELFLKVLIEGKSNLYEYVEGNLKRYFYKKENSIIIEQLIYKRYLTIDNKIGKNNRYRQQLWIDLKCPNFKMSKIENIEYKKNDLVRFFIEYNKCHNISLTNFESKQKRDLFNLTIRPRINSSSLKIQNSMTSLRNTDFGNNLGFGLGLEAEFILPFNKNKWALTIEPTYQNFSSEKIILTNIVVGGNLIAKVNYSSIEIPISLRHYFFINSNSKLFINTSFILDLSSKSSIEFDRDNGSSGGSLDIDDTRSNLAFGIGYKQNDRYSLELRYQTGRDILGSYPFWDSDYKTLSIILGYSLF